MRVRAVLSLSLVVSGAALAAGCSATAPPQPPVAVPAWATGGVAPVAAEAPAQARPGPVPAAPSHATHAH